MLYLLLFRLQKVVCDQHNVSTIKYKGLDFFILQLDTGVAAYENML